MTGSGSGRKPRLARRPPRPAPRRGNHHPPARLVQLKPQTGVDLMVTVQTLDPPELTPEQVRAACEAFLAALTVGDQMLAAYRQMVERFKVTGTLVPDDESRARLDALESDDTVFATMDMLDKLRRGEVK